MVLPKTASEFDPLELVNVDQLLPKILETCNFPDSLDTDQGFTRMSLRAVLARCWYSIRLM